MTTATACMTSTTTTRAGARAPLMHVAVNGLRVVVMWHERHSQRRALSGLTQEELTDIGVSQGDAAAEARKPFWRT